jgi:hypothetical protein
MKNPNVKKVFLTVVSAAAMAASSFAQGEVGFNQTSAVSPILINPQGPSVKMFGSAGTYDFGLYMGSAGATLIEQMQLVALATSPKVPASTTFNAGLFLYPGGTVTSPGNVANTLNFQAGTQYAFYVAGWAASGGSDFFTAIGSDAPIGQSALGFITPVTGTTAVPNVFGTSPGQVQGFLIDFWSPEPSTLAIGSLGAAALLLFRRRKSKKILI